MLLQPDPLPESDSRDQTDETRKSADMEAGENRNTAEGEADHHQQEQEDHEKSSDQNVITTSVFSNLTVFRDFFLAAFSDGYNVGKTWRHRRRSIVDLLC